MTVGGIFAEEPTSLSATAADCNKNGRSMMAWENSASAIFSIDMFPALYVHAAVER